MFQLFHYHLFTVTINTRLCFKCFKCFICFICFNK